MVSNDYHSDMGRLAVIRDAAIKERDAAIAAAGVAFAAECALEDKARDAIFDAARAAYEQARALPRPSYELPKERHAQALAKAEAQINETIKALYAAHHVVDSRYPQEGQPQ
jgi:hypothetical protein